MFEFIKAFFDTFGNALVVPVIIFIFCKAFRAPTKSAFSSAVLVAVGLKGMSFMTGAFGDVLTPLVQNLINTTGINLRALDIGWQAVSAVCYATDVGMIYLGLGIVWCCLLWLIKYTDIFWPSDLWNTYSVSVWGSIYYLMTGNFIMAMILCMFLHMVVLLLGEAMQLRWSTYYKYPNCVMDCPHHIGDSPFYFVLVIIFTKLHFDKINLSPENIRKRIGFLGEPMYIGLFVGLLLGLIGYFGDLTTLAGWSNVINVAVTSAAIMAIFPRIAGLFASGFTTLTTYSRKTLQGSKWGQNREFVIAVNDALGYGEVATLTTGILMIPVVVALAFILPGNIVVPVMVLPSLPYMSEVAISLSNGNIFKAWCMEVIVFAVKLMVASYWAEAFTIIAADIGFDAAVTAVEAGTFVIGFILSNPTATLITVIFLSGNPVFIALMVIVVAVAYVLFKKNKTRFQQYFEKLALRDDYVAPEATPAA